MRERLAGWSTIAARVVEVGGFALSPEAARKAAQRVRDPLPVRRWGRRVLAHVKEVDVWARRRAERRGISV